MTTAVVSAAPLETRLFNLNAYDRTPSLSDPEQAALAIVCRHRYQVVLATEETALLRLLVPIVDVLRMASFPDPTGARRVMLREMHRRQTAFWAWDEAVWSSILGSSGRNFQESVTSASGVRIQLLVLAYRLCGLRRLHRRVGMVRLPQLADLVFGHGTVAPAVDEVNTTLVSWRTSKHTIEWQVSNATLDLLLTCGSPRLEDVREAQLVQLVADYRRVLYRKPQTGRVQDSPTVSESRVSPIHCIEIIRGLTGNTQRGEAATKNEAFLPS